MSKRSREIAAEKAKCNALGHEMGNAVNVSPFNANSIYSVQSKCRHCRRILIVEGFDNDLVVVSSGSALSEQCTGRGSVEINGAPYGNEYDPLFVQRMNRIFAFVAMDKSEHVEAFPANIEAAYQNESGDGILANFATEMFEGNEPDGKVPTEQGLVDHSVHLLCRVRDDLDYIIGRLENYTPEKADKAVAELTELMNR